MAFKATSGWGRRGRQLTAGERDEARHMLQALFEGTRTVRNAIEPQTGVLGLSIGQWRLQWTTLKRDLDAFTERLTGDREDTLEDALGIAEHLAMVFNSAEAMDRVAALRRRIAEMEEL
jgi:hypothetical protein